jgi:hypothetical protein
MGRRTLVHRVANIADTEAMFDQAADVGMRNRASLVGTPVIHTPTASTFTAFMGARLTARASGLFVVALSAQYVALAGDSVTWAVTSYTDAVAGTPLTLPANAQSVGLNCYVDNTGAGISPSAGATVGVVNYGPTSTIGTAAVDDKFSWTGIIGSNITITPTGAPSAVPYGQSFYVTLSVQNTVATRAIPTGSIAVFELA